MSKKDDAKDFSKAWSQIRKNEIATEEMLALLETDKYEFSRIKQELFCPSCMQAKMKWVNPKKKKSYFASIDKSSHDKSTCSYYAERITSKIIHNMDKGKIELLNIPNELDNLLNELIADELNEDKPTRNASPTNVKSKNDKEGDENDYVIFRVNNKKAYIPKKKLKQGCFTDDDVEELFYCYGKVMIKFGEKIERMGKHKPFYTINCLIYNEKNQLITNISLYHDYFRNYLKLNDDLLGAENTDLCYLACLATINKVVTKDKIYYNLRIFQYNNIKLVEAKK